MEIHQNIQRGIYGPLTGHAHQQRQLEMSHHLLWVNAKPEKRPSPPGYAQVNPEVYAYIMGEEHVKQLWKAKAISQFKKLRSEDVRNI